MYSAFEINLIAFSISIKNVFVTISLHSIDEVVINNLEHGSLALFSSDSCETCILYEAQLQYNI